MQAPEFHNAIGNWSAALPHSRMSVYRNNVAGALVNALKVRFPVTEQLVGPEFFAAMALTYADGHRPLSPVLIEYGGSLPDFIRLFPPAANVPYLGDVARLEDLWWQAYHAADAPALAADALSEIDPERLGDLHFTLHPAVGLFKSSFAVGDIWHAHHGGREMKNLVIYDAQCMLVARPLADVSITIIPPARLAFLNALKCDGSLAEAVELGLELSPDFDITSELSSFFTSGIATGFST